MIFKHVKRVGNFRSTFEAGVARGLEASGTPVEFETKTILYHKEAKYKPDFLIHGDDGKEIIIEAKGFFKAVDRTKMLLVKNQHPQLDIRFVFQRAKNKLGKGSKTTYAQWAERNGFPWAEGQVPAAWLPKNKNAETAAVNPLNN